MSRQETTSPVSSLSQSNSIRSDPAPASRAWRLGAMQVACVLAGIAVLLWALLDARWRAPDGFPLGTIGLPLAVGASLLLIGASLRSAWQKAAFWAALGLTGQAAALQAIDAGPLLHYQHYWSMDVLAMQQPIVLLILLLQSILVLVGLVRRRGAISAWVACVFRPWQLVFIALLFVGTAAALNRNVGSYVPEVLWASWLQLVALGNLVLVIWTLPQTAVVSIRAWLDRLNTGARVNTKRLDAFAWIAALWVFLIAGFLATVSYQQHPHIPDEAIYYLQARFLAANSWALPAPPVPEAFSFYMVQIKGAEWFATTPPGWPAMLSIGMRLGVPWLVNPFLGALNVLLAYLLVQEVFDRRMARAVVLLLCVSPWFLFMSMNYMTHTFTLTCALGAGVLVAWAKQRQQPGWAFLAGAVAGAGSLIRPLDGLIVAGLLAVWLLGVTGWRTRLFLITAFGLGVLLTGAVTLPYNQALAGSPTVFPLNAYMDQEFGVGANDLGFGANRGFGWALQPLPGHSPLGALVNSALNAFSVNIELFGWATGSVLLMGLFLVAGKKEWRDYLLFAVIVVTIVCFGLYWYSGGPDFGARYWYLILIPCIILTIRGLELVQSKFGSQNAAAYIAAAVLVLIAGSAFNYLPWRALDKYYHYELMRPDILALAKTSGFGSSLVLIRGESFPDYVSTAVYNPLDLNAGEPIYAWDKDPATLQALLQAYAGRPIWIVEGPSLTKTGYQVVAGPLKSIGGQ